MPRATHDVPFDFDHDAAEMYTLQAFTASAPFLILRFWLGGRRVHVVLLIRRVSIHFGLTLYRNR